MLDMTARLRAHAGRLAPTLPRTGETLRALGYGEDFMRLWDLYFAYCEGGFRERAIGTAQFLFAKPGWRPAHA